MIDINTIFAQALATAIAEATKPLVERINALETKLAEAALFDRTTEVTIPVDEAKMVEALNSQEWFWEKLGRFVQTRTADAVDKAVTDAIEQHEESNNHIDEDEIDTKIEEAIEKHEENNTHGNEDDIEDIVNKLLRNASVSISISV